jgi:hypothetical protein
MNDQCPRVCSCSLFSGKLCVEEDSKIIYKRHYCLDMEESRWRGCKRFVVEEHIGFCPDYVLPNSLLSFEQIFNRIRVENPVIC